MSSDPTSVAHFGLSQEEIEQGWIINNHRRQPVPIATRTRTRRHGIAVNRVRRPPCCSYCLGAGHNVRGCNSNIKTEIERQIADLTNIEETGHFANITRLEMANIIFDTLITVYHHIGNQNIFILYFSVLNIRNPASALTYSIEYTFRKITQSVLNIRTDKICRRGIPPQIANELREEEIFIQVKNMRLNEIISLYGTHCDIYREIRILRENIQTEENDINLQELVRRLFELRTHYERTINEFRTIYCEEPEAFFLGPNIQDMRNYSGLNDLSIKITDVRIIQKVLTGDTGWTDIDCPICYDTIDKESVYMTNCSHKFCYTCISRVIQTDLKRPCPCCRSEIKTMTTLHR